MMTVESVRNSEYEQIRVTKIVSVSDCLSRHKQLLSVIKSPKVLQFLVFNLHYHAISRDRYRWDNRLSCQGHKENISNDKQYQSQNKQETTKLSSLKMFYLVCI